MRVGVEGHSSSNTLKKIIPIKVKEGNVNGLRELVKKMTTTQNDTLRRGYGNLLNLLEVKVQTPAIIALAQYYDPPFRCFTFLDFQLVPTVEEFE